MAKYQAVRNQSQFEKNSWSTQRVFTALASEKKKNTLSTVQQLEALVLLIDIRLQTMKTQLGACRGIRQRRGCCVSGSWRLDSG